VNFEGVGGLKVVDHTDCAGCYFEGEDCPNIDSNLLCSRNGKTVVYMPVPADEMGVTVSGKLHVAEITDSPIDRINEIDDALGALMCATSEFRQAKDAFEKASKWYAEARNNWTVAWNNVAAFARSTMPDAAPAPVSVPFIQTPQSEPIPTVKITVTQPYVSTDDALDERSIVSRTRPTLLPSVSGNETVEDKVLATLDFDNPLSSNEIFELTGSKQSTVQNALTRLTGCGLVIAERAKIKGKKFLYRLNDAMERNAAPGSTEELILADVNNWGSVSVDGVADRLCISKLAAMRTMGVMARAGLLAENNGIYSVAKKGE
jgi:predicted transcriptional regulator